jgi:small conductance mechanosensitive channel
MSEIISAKKMNSGTRMNRGWWWSLVPLLLLVISVPVVGQETPEVAPEVMEVELPTGPSEARPGYVATTTADPEIALDELALHLKPLNVAELQIEADAWLQILRDKVAEISFSSIAVKKQNLQIEIVEDVARVAEDAREAVKEAEEAGAAGDEEIQAKAREKSQEVLEALEEGRAAVQETLSDEEVRQAAEAAEEGAGVSTAKAGERDFDFESGEGLDAALEVADQVLDERGEVKDALLDEVTLLRTQRIALLDRLQVVLTEFESKGGEVEPYKQYMASVSGVTIDVADTTAAWATVTGWLTSPEGGLRWMWNIAKFLAVLLGAWILSRVLGKAARRATRASEKMSALLRDFIVNGVQRACLLVGAVMAISALGVNITPLLAALGGAAFVIAFALQGTLSNFASGVLIHLYRPFDVGDIVETGTISRTIDSLNLVSTHIRSFDNKLMIVPNNSIWGDVIINATGSNERRVDLIFGIGYGDDIGKAQKVMQEVMAAHELVLDKPEPIAEVHELGDSSVNFVCRPGVRPNDYWQVYWDITRGVKEAFDANGISIPFPQRDVHHYRDAPPEAEGVAADS